MWNSEVCVELRVKSTHPSISTHSPRKWVGKWVEVGVEIKNGTKECVEFEWVWIGDNTSDQRDQCSLVYAYAIAS